MLDPHTAILAADNAATASSDRRVIAIFLAIYALALTVIKGGPAAVALASVLAVGVGLGLDAARHPPPPASAGRAAQVAWRARRDGGALVLRLSYALLVNRVTAGVAPFRDTMVARRGGAGTAAAAAAAAAANGPHSWAAFLAGRHAPMLTALLAASARLPAHAAWGVAAASAGLIAHAQPGACAGVLATKPGSAPYFLAAAATGRRATTLIAASLLGDGVAPALLGREACAAAAADPAAACLVTMVALHFMALAGGTAARIRPTAERGAGRGAVVTREGWLAALARVALAAAGAGVAGVVLAALRGPGC